MESYQLFMSRPFGIHYELSRFTGFNYDTCCDPKFGPSGNSQCSVLSLSLDTFLLGLISFSQPKVGMESLTMTDVAFQRTSNVQMQVVVKQKKDICQEEL